MRIALTYTGSEEKHQNYIRWLNQDDPLEVIRLSAEDNNLAALDRCDALVLSGGIDMHPKFYKPGYEQYPNAPEEFRPDRDEFEIKAFRRALHLQLPVLGVCRGMQLVNCVLGGTLRQDLDQLNPTHKAEAMIDKIHAVVVKDNTLLKEIARIDTATVNSAHHQAIEALGKGLKINALAPDDTIEGLEWEEPAGNPFLLCIQWHPERMFKAGLQGSPLSVSIQKRFIDEIKKSKN